MENKSATVNYSKDNIVLNVSLSSKVLEIEATYLTTQTTYANTFEPNNTVDYNAVYNFIVSGEAKIIINNDNIQIGCGFNNYSLYATKKEETKLLKAEIALLKDEIAKLKNKVIPWNFTKNFGFLYLWQK